MRIKGFKKYLILLMLSFLGSYAYTQQQIIDIDVNNASTLEEVINELQTNYDFLFSYRPRDIENITFNELPKGKTIDLFLQTILKDSALKFDILDHKNIILVKVETPDPPGTIFCGKVIDSLTQTVLPYANAYIKNSQKGAIVGKDGSFQFRSEYGAQDSITISYVGYQQKTFLAADYLKSNCPSIELNYLDMGDDFIIITEYLTDGISLENNGAALALEPNKIGALPGQVEPDVLNTIQFLPGVSSPDGTAAGLSIRGGTPDQNLILWEDIPIYHSAHYFGMISAFNPYIINKVSVYRGGFGAEYGGRISGLIDLKYDFPANDEPQFGAGSNFISAYTNGRFSLLNKKLSVVYSARRSITELWRSPGFENITKRIHQGILVQNVNLNRLPPGISISDEVDFFDSNLKATYKVSEQDELSLAAFYGDNNFQDLIRDNQLQQEQTDTLVLKNNGINLSWKHQWNTAFSTKVQVMRSDFNYEYDYRVRTEGMNGPDQAGVKKSSIEEKQLRILNTYQTPSQHTFKLAYELINYDVSFELIRLRPNNNDRVDKNDLGSNLHVLYAAYNSPKEKKFGIDLGLRVTSFEQEQQLCLEPRIRLWYDVNKHLNIYANAGRYYQFLSQLIQIQGDNSSIETPVWALAGGEEVPVLDADQYQVGFLFRKNKWLFDLQFYTKKTNGLTSLATGFDETLVNRYHIGTSNIRGIDILLKKRWNNYSSWISYSLSKSDFMFPTFFDKEFPGPNDQRHIFNWANMWTVGNFECSLGWKMISGRPYSLLRNYEIIIENDNMGPDETIRPVVKEFNSAYLPLLHQLDASVLYNFSSKKKGDWKGVVGVSFYNLYHQRNLLNREFYIKQRPNDSLRLEYNNRVDMGFTPNFLIRFEW